MNEHLGGCYPEGDGNTFMPDVFSWAIVEWELKSVLSIGTGYGHDLKHFQEIGLCQIKGIDGWPEAVEKSVVPGHVILHDFTKGPAPLAQPFDLAIGLEFVEHVEEQYIKNWMPSFQLARHVIITHGEPGQAGHHHVCLHPSSWWVKKFTQYGFIWDQRQTELLRRTDRYKAPWGRRTLLVFHNL